MHVRIAIFFCLLVACGKAPSDSEIKLIGGTGRSNYVSNLVPFSEEESGAFTCGGALIVHPRVAIGPKHCEVIDSESGARRVKRLEDLSIYGRTPIEIFRIEDVINASKDSTNPYISYLKQFDDLDLAVFLFEDDLIESHRYRKPVEGMERMVPIASDGTRIGNAIGACSFGRYGGQIDRDGPVQRCITNTLDSYDQATWSFESPIAVAHQTNGAFTIEDSGGVILNGTAEIIGMISRFETKGRRANNIAVDLTSAPAKILFHLGQYYCKELGKTHCLPWFPGSLEQSNSTLGISLAKEREDFSNDRFKLNEFLQTEYLKEHYSPKRLSFQPDSSAKGNISDLVASFKIEPYYLDASFNETFDLFTSIATANKTEVAVNIGSQKITLKQKELNSVELLNADKQSYRIGAFADFKTSDFGATATAGLFGLDARVFSSQFRSLRIQSVTPNSLAAKLNLQVDDLIWEINHRLISNDKNLNTALALSSNGTHLGILRKGVMMSLDVKGSSQRTHVYDERVLSFSNEYGIKFIKVTAQDTGYVFKIQSPKIRDLPIAVKEDYFLSRYPISRGEWKRVVGCYPEDLDEAGEGCAKDGPRRRRDEYCYQTLVTYAKPIDDSVFADCVSKEDIEKLFIPKLNNKILDLGLRSPVYALPTLEETGVVGIRLGEDRERTFGYNENIATEITSSFIHKIDDMAIFYSTSTSSLLRADKDQGVYVTKFGSQNIQRYAGFRLAIRQN